MNIKLDYILVLVALLCMGLTSNGQQSPQFTQYLQNPFVVNPAMAGVEDYLDINLAYRNQWSGFEGAPRTATISLNLPTHLLKGRLQRRGGESHTGLGAFIYSDDTDPIRKSGFYAAYAYHLKVSRDWFLSMGTFLGAEQFSFDASEVVLLENPNDILVQNFSGLNLDASVGLYAYSKYLFAGIAANQIFDAVLPYDEDNGVLTTGTSERNFNLLVGTRIAITNDWELVPSTLLKAVGNAPIQWDINSKLVYQDKFWGGISYRNQDAISGLAGFRLGNGFLVSYSYDYAISDFSGIQSGTHEIIVGYRYNFGNQKCACPSNSL
ncbi:type IX secretion system membrane protein PorP/SprF [uncultured Croceitalea sp.]|uniref:PorP/SprF family type IX secretion system membrane protein n=1 Tax=uncultured Croceitalea sp. TaxID=1798908 RepID=UPI0033067FA4